MARNYPADTRAQKALEEIYEKESIAQLNWFLKCQEARKQYGATPLTASSITNANSPDIIELIRNYKLKAGLATENKDDELPINKPALICSIKLEPDQADMFPPSKENLKLLYDGNSEEGKGRMLYLKERNKLSNEVKFQYPILNSMEYGWGHAELISQTTAESKKYGRSAIVKDSFYKRNGIPFKHGEEMLGFEKQHF